MGLVGICCTKNNYEVYTAGDRLTELAAARRFPLFERLLAARGGYIVVSQSQSIGKRVHLLSKSISGYGMLFALGPQCFDLIYVRGGHVST
jgi:hypothetical protein